MIESQDGSYHSYTFPIIRKDSNGPLENLILSLQLDGSYSASLISYDLTNEEFTNLKNGGYVNLIGKTYVQPLEYDNIFTKMDIGCFWIDHMWCAKGNHEGGYEDDGSKCPAHENNAIFECFNGSDGSGSGPTGGGSDPGSGSSPSGGSAGSGANGGGSSGSGSIGVNDPDVGATSPTLCTDCPSLEEAMAEALLLNMTNESFLNTTQNNKLKEAFKQVIDVCTNKAFVNELHQKGFTFTFKINSNLNTPAGYNPTTKEISFRSTNDINYNSLLEELFHAYQDITVGIGSQTKPPYTGRSNIEFEAKLYADIVAMNESQSCCIAFWPSGNTNYWIWVNEITTNGSEFPTDFTAHESSYFDFLNEFIEIRLEYNYPIDNNLLPSTMLKVLKTCN